MTNIKIVGKDLLIDGKLVYHFEYFIKKYILYQDKIIVLVTIPENVIFNQNVYCFDQYGSLIWQIEDKEEHAVYCPYTGISINNGKFTPYKFCGVISVVDLNSGKVISSNLIK